MGWPGRYADALSRAGEVFNYYSTGDDTFEETPNPPWLLEGMDDSTSRYAWQKQETLKGSALPGGSLHGGWGFHQWRVSDPETLTWSNARFSEPYAAGLVATNAIPNCPVFNRGCSPMFNRGANPPIIRSDNSTTSHFAVSYAGFSVRVEKLFLLLHNLQFSSAMC